DYYCQVYDGSDILF
nr:immunoglobulin light chain junction region [Macaca mulatta]MOW14974.1 immunoglobulin light chain junction region [Macaca mulatta]MOW15081.1 immunoglobulin light chain junction region [Macaca mulatta]MOW15109.1 immunoglobulin light chain junction region [Macaca mulatta]MOW15411.1 immunoglobulin light chain junction region [Macaca mulatta]